MKMITVKDLAERLGRTTGRIRQIAIEYRIGTKVGTMRFFDESEVPLIAEHLREDKPKEDDDE